MVAGLGVTGRSADATRAATRGYAAAKTGYAMLRFGLSSLHLHVLVLAGRIHDAAAIADERRAEIGHGIFARANRHELTHVLGPDEPTGR